MHAVLFPTHLVAAWLLGGKTRLSSTWLVVGAAIPDLVDKPLAMLGAVELFHTVGHSAILGVLIIPLARRSPQALAIGVGWASHLLLDAGHVIVNGRPLDALFLGWPLVVPPAPLALGPVPFLSQYLYTPSFWIEFLIWAAAGWLLLRSRGKADPLRPDLDGA
jgi:hypothetical protein